DRTKAQEKIEQTIQSYKQNEDFYKLSQDKQEAILHLKDITPAQMPQEAQNLNLQNLVAHFNSKTDKAQREKYLSLFNDTKQTPDFVLKIDKNNEERLQFIKAYEHKENKDLYYIAITQAKDDINITGYPITRLSQVIKNIEKSKEVVRNFGGISNLTEPTLISPSPQLSKGIIPQIDKEIAELESQINNVKNLQEYHRLKNLLDPLKERKNDILHQELLKTAKNDKERRLFEWHKDSHAITKEADGT
ncbi:hypothetical protein, partial [Helicobacter sp. T3_23-1059]